MEKDYQTASGKFWQTIQCLRRGKQLSASTVYSVGGELLASTGDIVRRWKEYLEDLFNRTDMSSIEEAEAEDSEGCPMSPVLFITFMDRISRRSQGLEGVWFGDHRISSLLFADDVVLLAPSSQDLQHALEQFAAECKASGMRVSTSKSEAIVLNRKKVVCTLEVGGEFLPQVEEFKYLGVLFTSEGRMELEIDRRISAAAAVMRSMYRSVVVKKELSRKAKQSQASVLDASWTSPWGGVPGMPHQKETPGKTQDTLERLCLSADLGTPRIPSGRAGGSG
ncbi:hypothetical protein QTP86_024956 [Hemibagrus guttatus]|nr:hypothetical protein QTP86_024956 [Hemibagrus guttatus]